MSKDNVTLVREIYRAFAERRFPNEHLAEEFVWETAPDIPGAGSHEGLAAVRAYFGDWVGGWQEVESNVEQLIERGDRVVALIHGRYRLTRDQAPFEARYAHIWTLRDGQAVHAQATSGRTAEELGFEL
jgi:ketosteroid isomerase-like protein